MYALNVKVVPRSIRFSVRPLYSTKRTVKKSKFVWYIDRFPVGGGQRDCEGKQHNCYNIINITLQFS